MNSPPLAAFALALLTLFSSCRRDGVCEDAKRQANATPDVIWLAEGVKSSCVSDDPEAAAIVARGEELKKKRADAFELEAAEEKRQAVAARTQALSELQAFWAFAEAMLRSPAKGKVECFTDDDGRVGWCGTSEIASNRLLSAKWTKGNTKGIRIDSDRITRTPISCADIDPSATVVRRWHWEQAKKIQTRCRIGAGRFAGLGALIQFGQSNTFVSLFSDAYLAKDADLATALATQGTTIEQPAAAPGNERVYYAERIARAMSETANPPKAIGADGKILVPSSDPAKCIVWGSMWFRDTAPELRQLGFTELRCDAKVWKL